MRIVCAMVLVLDLRCLPELKMNEAGLCSEHSTADALL